MSSLAFVYFFTLVTLMVLITPVFRYFVSGWRSRKREIIKRFDEGSIKIYFTQFQPSEENDGDLNAAFSRNYDKRFGRKHFILPLVVLFVVSLFFLYLSAYSVLGLLQVKVDSKIVFPDVALAAIAGSYMWVAYDLINRNRSFDISPADISLSAFRMIISVPAGYAVANLFNDSVSLAVAFFDWCLPNKNIDDAFSKNRKQKAGRWRLSIRGQYPLTIKCGRLSNKGGCTF